MKSKVLTLKLVGYTVGGVADLKLWGGGNACIDMKQFLTSDISRKNLLKNLNDNGFGVEKINGGICDIFENYDGTLKFLKSVEVGNVSEATHEYYDNQYR